MNCAVVVVVSATVAIFPLIMKMHNPKQGFRLALVLIVSACPCALVLSTPIAYFCALLKAAHMGLLVKGGDVLEALSQVKAAAFDKTGTITRGEFTVREFHVLNSDIPLETLLYWYVLFAFLWRSIFWEMLLEQVFIVNIYVGSQA